MAKKKETKPPILFDWIPTSELLPYARNARQHSDAQIAKVAASIKEFGFLNPIIIGEDKTIIAGHCRLAAAQKLRLETVPTVCASHLTEIQRRAYVLADNRLAEDATWDNDILKLELQDLQLANFDVNLTGFGDVTVPEFTPNIPPDETNDVEKEAAFVLRIMFEDSDAQQALFEELRDRGFKVKV